VPSPAAAPSSHRTSFLKPFHQYASYTSWIYLWPPSWPCHHHGFVCYPTKARYVILLSIICWSPNGKENTRKRSAKQAACMALDMLLLE
jgi:hypothetical protein